MKTAGTFLFLLLLAGIVYFVAQQPEIRVLFQNSRHEGDPLQFLNHLPEIKPKKVTVKRAPRSSQAVRTAPPVSQVPAPDPTVNQVQNGEVARVLMQILAAKKLNDGVTLAVSDLEVEVLGEVSSEETLLQILEILDKGREARVIRTDNLRIAPKPKRSGEG